MNSSETRGHAGSNQIIESHAMPLIPDNAAFQNSLASLPLVTYQPGETVIVGGSKSGRLLILRKGTVAIVKRRHRDFEGGGAWCGVW
jgi:hypothetical protein